MSHPAAKLNSRKPDSVSFSEVIDIANHPAWLQHLDGLRECIIVASGNNNTIHTFAGRFLHDLLYNVTLPIVDDGCGAKFQSKLGAILSRSHRINIGRPANGCGSNRREDLP